MTLKGLVLFCLVGDGGFVTTRGKRMRFPIKNAWDKLRPLIFVRTYLAVPFCLRCGVLAFGGLTRPPPTNKKTTAMQWFSCLVGDGFRTWFCGEIGAKMGFVLSQNRSNAGAFE